VCREAAGDQSRLVCNATELSPGTSYVFRLTVTAVYADASQASSTQSLTVAKQLLPLPALSLRAPSRVRRSERALFAAQLAQSVCASAALAAAAFSFQWRLTTLSGPGPAITPQRLDELGVNQRAQEFALPQDLLWVRMVPCLPFCLPD
jgi:hypothetical protein